MTATDPTTINLRARVHDRNGVDAHQRRRSPGRRHATSDALADYVNASDTVSVSRMVYARSMARQLLLGYPQA